MKRKIRRTHFHYLGYSFEIHSMLRTVIVRENKIDAQIQQTCEELDRALIKLPLVRAKIKQVESEIKRRRIGQKQRLVYSTVLRPGPTTGELTGFLDLPAEMRNYIHDLSGSLGWRKRLTCWDGFEDCSSHMRQPSPITFSSERMSHVKMIPRDKQYHPSREWNEPALLRVSRQVRSDTAPIFFGMLLVHVWANERAWERMLKWLKVIGKGKAAMLIDIEIIRLRDPTPIFFFDKLRPTPRDSELNLILLEASQSTTVMASTSTHPAILLRDSLEREIVALESKFPPLRMQLRALRTDTYGIDVDSDGKCTSIYHNDLKSYEYEPGKFSHTEQESVHRKVNWAFDQLQVEMESKMTSTYGDIDALRASLKPWRTKLADLEHEIKRDGIVANTLLDFSPALHKMTAGRTAPTGFLDLPAELRNEIYKLSGCLSLTRTHSSPRTYPTTRCSIRDDEQCQQEMEQTGIIHLPVECGHHRYRVDVVSRCSDLDSGTVAAYYQPSLTRVSKKIRAETLPMFYGNIHVTSYQQRCVNWEEVHLKWIKHIGMTNAALLNRVTVEYDFWTECEIEEKKMEIYEVMKRLGVEVDRDRVLEIATPLVC
ncbi:hypothetical protein CBER1_05648 [Cercospora berteroae]|uniref:F-box domain-containing protein n=1 Tax=Cercospora berteroae TaxID=357750 RepID=A0A2S6C5J8_9PEZI|nr:hypothetical protein CBER1_05648 [Cercospora berteroae]